MSHISTKFCLLNLFLSYIFFTPSFSKSITKECKEIESKNGYFFLKYTFIKYTGSCIEYEKNGKISKIKNFVNGESQGVFKTYIDGIIHKQYSMKNNLLNGLYLEHSNGKVVKRIVYNEGEISTCVIDLSYVINEKNELKVMNEKDKLNDKSPKIIDEINERTLLLDNYLRSCKVEKAVD